MKHRIFGCRRRRRAALITAISMLLAFYAAPHTVFALETTPFHLAVTNPHDGM